MATYSYTFLTSESNYVKQANSCWPTARVEKLFGLVNFTGEEAASSGWGKRCPCIHKSTVAQYAQSIWCCIVQMVIKFSLPPKSDKKPDKSSQNTRWWNSQDGTATDLGDFLTPRCRQQVFKDERHWETTYTFGFWSSRKPPFYSAHCIR